MLRSSFTIMRVILLASCCFVTNAAHAQMVWNRAASFDGVSYLAIPPTSSLSLTKDFTLEAWVNTTSAGVITVVKSSGYALLVDNGRGRLQVNGTTRLFARTPINDGTWHHLAVAYAAAGQYAAFVVDGVVDTNTGGVPAPDPNVDTVYIGGSPFAKAPAKLDEIRIWGKGLTLSQIDEYMHMSLSAGTGIYEGLVLSLPFQSPDDPEYTPYFFDVSGLGNDPQNRGAVVVDAPAAPSSYVYPNLALSLDGAGSYAVAPADANIPSSGDFTLEAWIYPKNAASGAQQAIISREISGSNEGYELSLLADGKLAITTAGGVGSSSMEIPSNQWTHVAATYTYNGTAALTTLYVNGKIDKSYGAFPYASVSDSLCIGRSATQTNYFTGYIDEVRLSNYAKSEEQIQQGMFAGINYENHISGSNIELVYGMDGSAAPSSLLSPRLTLRGNAAFSSQEGSAIPTSPLEGVLPSSPSFPRGYYLRNAEKLIVPGSPYTTAAFEDTLNVGESVTINNLRLFLGFAYGDEADLTITLFSPRAIRRWFGEMTSNSGMGPALPPSSMTTPTAPCATAGFPSTRRSGRPRP